MRRTLLVLFAVLLTVLSSVAACTTPILLTTSSGACTFNATSYTATPVFSATGSFGVGCPGYVPPVDPPVNPPGVCVPPYASRQQTTNAKSNPSKPGGSGLLTADQVFNSDYTRPPTPFPWIGNRSPTIAVNANQYLALPINVLANTPQRAAGRFGFFDTNFGGAGAFPTGNGSTYSISTCPGDFNVAPACKKQWTGQDGDYLVWAMPEEPDPTRVLCHLQRGQIYFLNIINGTIAKPGTSTCSGATCAHSISYFKDQ